MKWCAFHTRVAAGVCFNVVCRNVCTWCACMYMVRIYLFAWVCLCAVQLAVWHVYGVWCILLRYFEFICAMYNAYMYVFTQMMCLFVALLGCIDTQCRNVQMHVCLWSLGPSEYMYVVQHPPCILLVYLYLYTLLHSRCERWSSYMCIKFCLRKMMITWLRVCGAWQLI